SIYYKTNTVYSLWLVRNEIKKDFVYLNGDVLFHKDVLNRLINSKYDNCLAIDKKDVGEEEVKVKLLLSVVKAIGKKIERSKAQGEFIGIAKFSQRFNELFIMKLDEVVRESKITAFFEVALNRALKDYDIYAVDVSDLPCIEIDSHEDFNLAKSIYLKIAKMS
ncbi:MAG: phosphocholine cytidylyltransferase family protein, partial [Candidatus Hodarchaeota archaeon]